MSQSKLPTRLEYIDSAASEITLSVEEKSSFADPIVTLKNRFLSVVYQSVPMVYLLGYTTGKQTMMSKSAEAILGWSKGFTDGRLGFTINLYQEDHLKVVDSQFFHDRVKVLKAVPPENIAVMVSAYTIL